jgi:hypothetical protein
MARGKVRNPALTNPITMTVVALDNCTGAVANARDANASIGLAVNCTSACRAVNRPRTLVGQQRHPEQKQTRRRVER